MTQPTSLPTNMTQQTVLPALIDGVPVDAINALLRAIRDLGGSLPSIVTRYESKGMSGCSPCSTITSTTISFAFISESESEPTCAPTRAPSPASSTDSLEYLGSSLDASELPPSESASPAADPNIVLASPLATAIGAPGLTPGAATRWYAVTVGTNVGVFQGCETIKPFINGISRNTSVGYANRELAVAAFANAIKAGKVEIVVA